MKSTATERKCLGCGKIESRPPHSKTKFFCSKDCRLKRRKELYWEERKDNPIYTTPIKCLVCGKEFLPSPHIRYKAKYCSESCKKRLKRQQMTAYLRANPQIRKEYYRKMCMRKKWGGNWWKALTRDNFTCRFCGHVGGETDIRKKLILVHHLDGQGETGNNNHVLENLATSCYDCHKGLHGISLIQIEGGWFLSGKIFERLNLRESPPIQ